MPHKTLPLRPVLREVLRSPFTRGGGSAPGPALLLPFIGQSNATRRAPKDTTSYVANLYTFTGANEAVDRTDGGSVTSPMAATVYGGVQSYSEFGVSSEGLAPGYARAVYQNYSVILTHTPALGARHWRELMPGTGSWANMLQALKNGRRHLMAIGLQSANIRVVLPKVHGESDADDTPPGGAGSEGGTPITTTEFVNIETAWLTRTRKAVRWIFASASKTITMVAYQPVTVSGAGSRNVAQGHINAAVALQAVGYVLAGPMYWLSIDTDGVHVLGGEKDLQGEYMALRVADADAGNALPVKMDSATRVGAAVTVTCTTIGSNTSLVIDTTNVPETTTSFPDSKNGFQCRRVSDSVVFNVTAVAVNGVDPKKLDLTLASDPGSPVEIRYGLMDWPGGTQSTTGSGSKLARGNIRDNGTRTGVTGNTFRNWMCHGFVTTGT